jgi:hypothetical protein
MKKSFLAAIGVMVALVLLLIHYSRGPLPSPESPSAQQSSSQNAAGNHASAPAAASGPGTTAASAAASSKTAGLPSVAESAAQDLSARAGQYIPPAGTNANVPPQAVVQNLRRAVRQYGQMFGGDPVGNNSEITAELTGSNPKQINFLSGQDGMTINQNGELVDQWGTPYFFHQLSASDMEVRSAGPDKHMWTSDDIVTK